MQAQGAEPEKRQPVVQFSFLPGQSVGLSSGSMLFRVPPGAERLGAGAFRCRLGGSLGLKWNSSFRNPGSREHRLLPSGFFTTVTTLIVYQQHSHRSPHLKPNPTCETRPSSSWLVLGGVNTLPEVRTRIHQRSKQLRGRLIHIAHILKAQLVSVMV